MQMWPILNLKTSFVDAGCSCFFFAVAAVVVVVARAAKLPQKTEKTDILIKRWSVTRYIEELHEKSTGEYCSRQSN